MTRVLPPKTAPLTASLMRWRRWVILAMLFSLHAGLISPPGGDFQRIWLIVHFGLFLLWQPFISTGRELNFFATLLFFGVTGVVIFSLSGWMMMTWVAILIGIMGGKVFTLQAARRGRFYLVAVFYLFAILLLWATPVLLLDIRSLPEGLPTLAKIALPIVLLLMTVLPYRAEDETSAQVFDFFYSLFIFQLVVVLVLGSIAAMRVTDNSYFSAVLLTVLSFSGALLILAVLWAPRAGYGGLRTYFSRYLMSVGMPFELWMRRIAALSEADMTSARFLQTAMAEVATMPWILVANGARPTAAESLAPKPVTLRNSVITSSMLPFIRKANYRQHCSCICACWHKWSANFMKANVASRYSSKTRTCKQSMKPAPNLPTTSRICCSRFTR